jgi:hypothetical protein
MMLRSPSPSRRSKGRCQCPEKEWKARGSVSTARGPSVPLPVLPIVGNTRWERLTTMGETHGTLHTTRVGVGQDPLAGGGVVVRGVRRVLYELGQLVQLPWWVKSPRPRAIGMLGQSLPRDGSLTRSLTTVTAILAIRGHRRRAARLGRGGRHQHHRLRLPVHLQACMAQVGAGGRRWGVAVVTRTERQRWAGACTCTTPPPSLPPSLPCIWSPCTYRAYTTGPQRMTPQRMRGRGAGRTCASSLPC